ncbi:MAG TPA: AraC family transcriptional regulator [Bacilli bacterium]
MPIQADLNVLSSGYSFHKKPYSIKTERLKFYLFRLQTEGTSIMRVDNRLQKIVPGDLLIFGMGEPYELIINRDSLSDPTAEIASGDYYLFARGPWMDEWWKQQKRPQKLNIQLNDNLISLFRQLVAEQRKPARRSDEILLHYTKIICLTIDRMLTELPGEGKAYVAQRIKRYIEQNSAFPFKLEDAAAAAGVSVSRAVHLFKQTFGKSIMQYTLEVRLHLARERLIYSPVPLHVIAETSGFSSYTYFFRVFREHFGLSPKQYRNKYSEY